MKKRLLLIPLFGMLLSGCDFLSFLNKNPENQTEQKDDDEHEDDHHDDEDDKPVKVDSISLNKTILSLYEGETETLTYTILPANAENKKVTWSTSNDQIATVNAGVVNALSAGTCTITVTTEDGSKQSVCALTVNKLEVEKEYVTTSFVVNEQGYTSDKSLTNSPIVCGDYTVTFAVGENTYNNQPGITQKNKHYEIRVYWGNTFTVTSNKNALDKIEFVKGPTDKGNTLTCSTGTVTDNVWLGNSKEITFSVQGTSGYLGLDAINFCYEGTSGGGDDDDVVDLGVKTIAEVKQYIHDNPVKKNAYGIGVNEKCSVTIKGFALATIDLEKYTAKYGLDISEHGKVIMGDSTGVIGVATKVNNQGTTLWGKVGNNECKSTSKYVVTGYISEYLGNPEILVTSFTWDQSLNIEIDLSKIPSEISTLEQFYEKATNVNYNCAGHGYGEVVTVKNLKCYYMEADGQGKRYYNFTDGIKNIRVNAFNISGATVGNYYNVTGIISIKNLSPIIVAFNIESAQNIDFDFDYESIATPITISDLKKIHGSQDDTDVKFPNVINAYGNIYKTTGYLTAVVENLKYYVGISDNYIDRKDLISGKDNAMANYGVSLIKNDNFWNTTEEELYRFNPTFDDYLLENKAITVYYVVRQQRYSQDKPLWEILLLPDFITSITPVEE